MDVIILGAGGHAKVIIDIIRSAAADEHITPPHIQLLDDNVEVGTRMNDCEVTGPLVDCFRFMNNHKFIIGIGSNTIRKVVAERYDLPFYTAIHPDAVIGSNVKIGTGSVVMAGVVINTGTSIGNHCIINTGSTIDHENLLRNYVHVSPGVHTGGDVTIGAETWLGIGCCIKNGVSIGDRSVIGAGAVATGDIPGKCVAVGCPARVSKAILS